MADGQMKPKPASPARELYLLTCKFQGGCKYIHNLHDELNEIGWKPYYEFQMTYWRYVGNNEYGPQQEAIKEALSKYKRDDGTVDFVLSKVMGPSVRGDPVLGVQNMLGVHHLFRP